MPLYMIDELKQITVMNRTILSAVIISCIVATGCERKKNIHNLPNGCSVINVSLNDVVNLSDFAESIEIIKLSNDSVLRDIGQMTVDKNGNIFIKDSRGAALQQYAPDGKFIRQIGRKGNGPGEYTRIDGIDIDGDRIYINDDGKGVVMAYDAEGNYIPDIPIMDMTYHLDFACKGDTLIKSYAGNYISFDINGRKYQETLNRVSGMFSIHSTHLSKNTDDGTVYWERHYNDTIFEAVGGNVRPFVYVDFGKLKLPDDIPVNPDIEQNPEAMAYCRDVSNFKISNDIIAFLFEFKKEGHICIYNRHNKKTFVYKALHNDISDIPITFPLVRAIQGKKIYFSIAPDRIAEICEMLKRSKEKAHHDLLKKITDTLGEVHEMDNPYIAVVTCK